MREQRRPSETDVSARVGSDAAGRLAGGAWGAVHRPPAPSNDPTEKSRARTLYTAFLAATFVVAAVLSIPLSQVAKGPTGHGGRAGGPQAAGPAERGRLPQAGQGRGGSLVPNRGTGATGAGSGGAVTSGGAGGSRAGSDGSGGSSGSGGAGRGGHVPSPSGGGGHFGPERERASSGHVSDGPDVRVSASCLRVVRALHRSGTQPAPAMRRGRRSTSAGSIRSCPRHPAPSRRAGAARRRNGQGGRRPLPEVRADRTGSPGRVGIQHERGRHAAPPSRHPRPPARHQGSERGR